MQFFMILMGSLLLPLSWLQEPAKTQVPEAPYIEREEKQFNFFPGGKLEITAGVPGNITIVGWHKGSIRMEAEKIVYYHSAEQAMLLLKAHPIRVRWTQTSSTLRIAEPTQSDATMEYNLTLYVPKEKTDIRSRMKRGDFSIESVNGWVEVSTSEGSLEAKSMEGYFSGETLKGDISVEMSGKNWKGLEFAGVTRLGSVDVKLPIDYSAALQLETRDGTITIDYPPQIVEGEPEPPQIVVRKNSQSLKGAVGDGGSPLKLVTYAGDIRLSRKE